MTTQIEIKEVDNDLKQCAICKLDLTRKYYRAYIKYSRDGFETTDYKYFCADCLCRIYAAAKHIFGEYDD